MLSFLTGFIPTEAIVGLIGLIGAGITAFFARRSGRKAERKEIDLQDAERALKSRKEAAEVKRKHNAEVPNLSDDDLDARLETSRAKKKPARRKPARK